jgi:hypothetical protein
VTSSGGYTALLLGATLLTPACTSGPEDRSGFYNLTLIAAVHDFVNQRRYDCQVGFELDVQVPLPDTFTTVADARVRRAVVRNAGIELAQDSTVRGVGIRLERLPREDPPSDLPDSVQITLSGGITDTLHGIGNGAPDGCYDGAWSCASTIPPRPRETLRQVGYPDAEIQPGEWHLFPHYPGD